MEKRCFACMNLTDTPVCRHCGYNNDGTAETPGQEQFLKPGIVIGGRYYIGIPIDRNGEGITYIAYDNESQLRVRVREFFPGSLCSRDEARKGVTVRPGYEIQFQALQNDFVELARQLMELHSNNCLLHPQQVFAANGTVYVVYEDVVGISLTKYLREKGGTLTWEETENLFLPLLYTVKLLNANGIVHRGISPDTILVSSQRELRLKGVCTSAVRAINTGIKPELFGGYAAPEQYEKCVSHGEWTDVYALCAVLYKVLTGTMPPRADMRETQRLIPPHTLDPRIPKTVSDAIMHGMEPQREIRTQFVKDLIGDLYAAEAPEPVVAGARRILDEEEETVPPPRRRRRSHRFRVPIWLVVILVTLPLMLALFWLASLYILGPQEPVRSGSSSSEVSVPVSQPVSSEASSAPSSQESSEDVIRYVVDDFTGQYYEDVMQSQYYQNLFVFKPVTEVYDDAQPPTTGRILEQDVEAGTAVPQGTEIGFVVSKGPQYVLIPPTTDENGNPMDLENYQKYFTDRGVEVTVEEQESVFGEPGDVIGTSIPTGETMDRETENTIVIYVVVGTGAEAADALPEEDTSSEDGDVLSEDAEETESVG